MQPGYDGEIPQDGYQVLSSSYYVQYGLLADLGLRKDRPFNPDAEMTAILTEAAERGNEQLAVAAFASTAPVPAGQFWSVTLYDLDTRSEINTKQFKPVLTSLRDNLTPDQDGNITLYFGPESPKAGVPWLQTSPEAQWFTYFRIYGPGQAAFDGTGNPPTSTAHNRDRGVTAH